MHLLMCLLPSGGCEVSTAVVSDEQWCTSLSTSEDGVRWSCRPTAFRTIGVSTRRKSNSDVQCSRLVSVPSSIKHICQSTKQSLQFHTQMGTMTEVKSSHHAGGSVILCNISGHYRVTKWMKVNIGASACMWSYQRCSNPIIIHLPV